MSLINQVLQDLEKRHASESELNSLPPLVRSVPSRRQSIIRLFAITLTMALVVMAVAVFIYNKDGAQRKETPQSVSNPITARPPDPVSVPNQAVAASIVDSPAQMVAFVPVSRLSAELSLVAPLPAPTEKPAPVARRAKPIVANSLPELAAVRQADGSQTPNPQKIPRAETVNQPPPQPASAVPERLPPPAGAPAAAAEDTPSAIDKHMREVAPAERAEIAFRKGVTQIQEGRPNAAELDFRDALTQDPAHVGALQALLGLLLDSGRNNEAEQFLHKALATNPRQPRHAMVLARLEVERGEVTGAINTMVGALPYVQSDPDFYAFLAALLQREGRHREAVDYYRVALRAVPGNGVWMMGLGISLRASNQSAEAHDAFLRAIDSKQLSPALQEFVERQLRELSVARKR